MAKGKIEPPLDALENAYFEQITMPNSASFLWRCDDYPWGRNVWNYHPEFEIHLIRKSQGLCYIGDHIGNFEAGHLSMVGRNLPHNWISLPVSDDIIKDRDIVVQFSSETYLQMAEGVPELAALRTLFEEAALGIEFCGNTAKRGAELLEAMRDKNGIERFSLMIALLSLFSNADDARPLASRQFASRFRSGSSHELKKLETALNYLQENYLSGPKIGDVAELLGMSESAFSRFFKTHTGNSYTDHVTTLRIWMAKQLLRSSVISVTEVCYEAGFSNISNFNRTFLKHTEMRPLQYRKAAMQM